MSAEEILRSSESSALENNQVISHVVGKRSVQKKSFKTFRSLGAAFFITIMLVVFLLLFGTGNLVPSAISVHFPAAFCPPIAPV